MKKFCLSFMFFCLVFASQVAAQEIGVEVNGQAVRFTDAVPALVEGRTLVPLRGVFEQMGFSIDWNADTSTAMLQREGMVISITSGNDFIVVNNQQIRPEVPPQIIGGRFMLPLRTIAEATGDNIEWQGATSTAVITTAGTAPLPAPPVATATATSTANIREEMSAWITATASIINYQNHENPLFHYAPPGTISALREVSYREHSISLIRRDFNINNADDLRRQVVSLLLAGHNSAFWDAVEVAEALSAEDATPLSVYTLELAEKWGDRGIIAWDLFRVGVLVSIGHAAGHIDYEEALVLMEPAANLLKLAFSSWAEATENYIDGFEWWNRGTNPDLAVRRWHTFRNVIPAKFTGIYNDALFSNPLTENFQQIETPADAANIYRGTWSPATARVHRADISALVGSWDWVSGEGVSFFQAGGDVEFFADGTVVESNFRSPGDFSVTYSGTMFVTAIFANEVDTVQFTYTINDNILTIMGGRGRSGTWRRN